jgi:hypothetical protein
MIFEQHGISKTQNEIAIAMKTDLSGTTLDNQLKAVPILTKGALQAVLDETASLDQAKKELRQDRPVKVGTTGHTRACGGFKVEEGGKNSIYIYDPWPPNQGEIYYEDRAAVHYTNHIYIRP